MTESLLNGVAGGGRKLPRLWPFVVAFVIVCATLITCAVLNMISLSSHSANRPACERAVLTLVQSIPVVDFDIQPAADSMPTHDAFIALADASIASLDFTAMYMDLNASADQDQFSHAELATLGAGRGAAVLDALFRAAQRGVSIRILLGTLNNPINSTEVRSLLRYPNVAARIYDPRKWYGGGGIMHLKLWHSDAKRAYLGSANADWKSLAQVKEVGVLINTTRSGGATADLGRLYEVFWAWSDPALIPESVCTFSEPYQSNLTVPPWDTTLPTGVRDTQVAPFSLQPDSPVAAITSLHNMQPLCLSGSSDANPSANLHVAEGDAHAFVSASPGGAVTSGRTPDIDALVYTIRSATRTLSLSVMDFLPASAYGDGHGDGPVYWPALIDAVLAVAFAKPVRVRVLTSHWIHTNPRQAAAMSRLADGLAACTCTVACGAVKPHVNCSGSLEVRTYEVPGWNETLDANGTRFPSHSRVNHAKYIVSDQRLNIGTSNWQWGYFHDTAGASFNTDAQELIATAQSVFDADWESSYAIPVLSPSS